MPCAFLNRVGGQDEIVFDGASFVVNPGGGLALQLPDWEEASVVTRWTKGPDGWRCEPGEIATLEADLEHVLRRGGHAGERRDAVVGTPALLRL